MAKRAKIASLAILWGGGKIRIFAVLSCINAFKYEKKYKLRVSSCGDYLDAS